jgi:hypothetical protein
MLGLVDGAGWSALGLVELHSWGQLPGLLSAGRLSPQQGASQQGTSYVAIQSCGDSRGVRCPGRSVAPCPAHPPTLLHHLPTHPSPSYRREASLALQSLHGSMERLSSKVAGEEAAIEAVRRQAQAAAAEEASALSRTKAQLAELVSTVAAVSGKVGRRLGSRQQAARGPLSL